MSGVTTNLAFLRALTASEAVRSGRYDTTFIERELESLLESHRGTSLEPLMLASAFAVSQAREEQPAAPSTGVPPWLAAHRSFLR